MSALKEYWRADDLLAHRCPKCGRPADGAWRETTDTRRTVTYDPCLCEVIESRGAGVSASDADVRTHMSRRPDHEVVVGEDEEWHCLTCEAEEAEDAKRG